MSDFSNVSWGTHPPGHDCDLCAAFREQLANAKTTAADRVSIKIDLTNAEADQLDALAESMGVSRKGAAEILVREMLSTKVLT